MAIFGMATTWRNVTGIWWAGARDSAKHLSVHRAALQQRITQHKMPSHANG